MEPFVHLHVHTEYSLLDGANRIPDLVAAAARDQHAALAITDHGNLFGAVEFYKACRKADVKPILGCEVYVAQNGRKKKHSRRDNPYTHLTLLARDMEGWHNLMKLTSIAHLDGFHFRPRVDLEVLHQHARGITCLSGCMSGPVNRALSRDDQDGAFAIAGELRDLYGPEHFYLEVMRNGMEAQDRLTEGMVELRKRLDSPLIATNDIHYLRHEDCQTQDVLLCIHTGAKRDDPSRWRMDTETLFFRTREQMNRIFGDLPEALRNTLTVADQVNLELELGRYRLPKFLPDDGSSPEDYFRRLCQEGFQRLYPDPPAGARERLEYEMGVIQEMGFVSYFLIVWDLIRFAHEAGIPVGPGRGSAAGSIVAYCLNITRIDPLRYDLIFERFLNPSRISMPDIDIDFCKAKREEMLHYVRRRYGDENVCQIITFGKMKARAALRDVARVLDVPLSEVDKVAKKVPEGPKVQLAEVLQTDAELQAVRKQSELHQDWLDLAVNIEGLSRHSSVHAAGVVIADEPLKDIIPLSQQDGAVTTQWDMKICEEFGLLKMDFLGLRTLTILADAAAMVKEDKGVSLDLDALALDDPDTFRLLQQADTEGVFQLESGGMRRLLGDLKPSTYEDIIAVLALFRPGPLGSGLHETYARRKHGAEKVSFPHPLLEEILQETYGVLIYQEQIMRVAQKLAGFTLSDADSLRKAMGKKNEKLMGGFAKKFLDGCQATQVDSAIAQDIWDMMVKFAEYGFNKSHSAAYAMVTYQAAWMKAHYPEEFYASTFTHEAQDSDKLRTLIEDARRHEIRVLPPCLRQSKASFTVTGEREIRFGFAAVKGIGQSAAEKVVELRQARQEEEGFPNADEFLIDGVAAGLTKGSFESLVRAGAFDCFGEARIELMRALEERLKVAQAQAKDRQRGQGSLFDMFGGSSPTPSAAVVSSSSPQGDAESSELNEEDWKEILAGEKEALGLFLTRHPLDPYRNLLAGISPHDSRNVHEATHGHMVALAGIATHVQVRPTRKDPNKKYARLRIEDLYGSTGALIWASTLENVADYVVEDFIGLFHGTLEQSSEEPVLLVEKIEPLATREKVKLAGSLQIQLQADPPIRAIADILRRHAGPSLVRFHYQDSEGRPVVMRAARDWSVKLDSALLDELQKLLGKDAARIVAESKSTQPAEKPRYRRRAKTSAASASS
ncbi:MAG: DNA polymerase III subunit alpha [Planctomycetota bacterium]|nr:MAG: DNA polymerase III subunit alpha [Planctomycetota bacterium]